MANTKISNLTGAASVTDVSVFPVVDGGSTKKVTGTQIKTYARSGLSTVAVSGSYTDLTNKPTLFNGAYASLTGKPTLFDGNYNSLTNKPSLFDGNYNSLTNKPTLFDGNYNSLTNKPTIPADISDLTDTGSLLSQGSGVTSYNDLNDKPMIPTSLGDLGITAGSDGQVLTLNSSLIPVWTTPSSSGGATDRLVNGDYSFVLDEHGGIVATNGSIGPTLAGEFGFGANAGANAVIKANGGFSTWTFRTDGVLQLPSGGDIVDSTGTSVLGGGSGASTGSITFIDNSIIGTADVIIGFDQVASPAVNFSFSENGVFTAPTISLGINTVMNSAALVECLPNVDTVVYTATDVLASTIKALFHVEGVEDGTQNYEAQSCEMMIATISNKVSGSVYGLSYTSNSPLATFTTRLNSQINKVEILCRPSSSTESVRVSTSATEMFTTP